MSDIVERLRAGHGRYSALVREAADEIERLRARIGKMMPEALEYELRAEIERLTAALRQIVSEAESDDGLTAWDGGDIARAALEGKP